MSIFTPIDRNGALALVVAVAALIKCGLWFVYGPAAYPDTASYVNAAESLLKIDWSQDGAIFSASFGLSDIRMIGYPIVIAFAHSLAGDQWANAVVALQIAVSIAATAAVWNWAMGLTGSLPKSAITALATALGQSATFDIALLTDSLFSSIAIILLCRLSGPPASEASLRPLFIALVCGLGVAAMVLLRANGIHIAILFTPLALIWVWKAPGRRLPLAAALLLPALITMQVYIYWNQARTGERFLTTSARIVAFQPLYEMAQHGTDVFTGSDALSLAVQRTKTNFGYSDILALNTYLSREYGWSNTEIAARGRAAFFDAAVSEPAALLQNAARAFGFSVIRSIFNPALTLSETHHLTTGKRLFPGFSKIVKSLSDQTLTGIVYAAAYLMGAVFSTVLFLAFLFLAPFKSLGPESRQDGPAQLALWAGILAMLGYYSLIHLELRYILSGLPFIVGLGLWALPKVRRRRSTG